MGQMKKFVYPMLTFVLAAGGACAAQSDQLSLGDLAKQNRREKKVVKVLTNDDVATARPETQSQGRNTDNAASAAPASSDAAVKSPEKAKDAEKASSAAKSAPKDRPQVTELKQKLESYKETQDGWKRTAQKYEDLLATETSDFRRQMYEEALQGDKKNVEIFQDKIDQTQADLAKAEKSSSSSQ
jgi:hypothetical protein